MSIIALSITLMSYTNAQDSNSPVDKLFNKYANKDGFTTVNVSGALLNFMGNASDSADEASKMLSQLSGIRILTVEDSTLNKKLNFYKELEADGFFKNNKYETLLEVTEKNEIVRFFSRKGKDGKFSELLLIVAGNDNTIISIRGVISPKEIGKIAQKVDIDIN